MTACGQNRTGETGTAPGDTGSEPASKEENIIRAEFDFERRTVIPNSGYEMPVNGLGTYSLHGNECINALKFAL